jgi:hypothetical protein
MKIKEVAYTRKYNLGGYETEDITLTAELADHDSPQTALLSLADEALNFHLANKRKAVESVGAQATSVKLDAPVQSPQTPTPTTLQPPARAGFDINQLPTELRQHLTHKEGKIYKEYTPDKEIWVKINQALKDRGYEWVSAGKDSHWRLKQ